MTVNQRYTLPLGDHWWPDTAVKPDHWWPDTAWSLMRWHCCKAWSLMSWHCSKAWSLMRWHCCKAWSLMTWHYRKAWSLMRWHCCKAWSLMSWPCCGKPDWFYRVILFVTTGMICTMCVSWYTYHELAICLLTLHCHGQFSGRCCFTD